MKKYLWVPLLGFGLSATAQTGTKTYLLDEAPRYSEETGYGYDLVETPAKDPKTVNHRFSFQFVYPMEIIR